MNDFIGADIWRAEVLRLRAERDRLAAQVEAVRALLATHPSAVWVSELRAALGDHR